MPFSEPQLTFKAIQYANNADQIHIGTDTIKLVPAKQGSGYEIGDEQILVKVHSAALNPVDLILKNSAYPFLSWFFGKDHVYGMGRDYSGTIVSIGSAVSKKFGFKLNDNVCGLFPHAFGKGSISEYIVVNPLKDDSAICLQPELLNMNEASSWPLVFGTAIAMIESKSSPGKLDLSSRIVVLGASTSVGRYVIQLAKKFGVKDIVGTCSPRSAETVKSLGATATVDYTNKEVGIYAPLKAIVTANKGEKFDMVFDCCGSSELFVGDRMKKLVKPKGDYVTISGDVKYDYGTVHVAASISNNLKLSGRLFLNALGLLPYHYHFAKVMPGSWVNLGKKSFEDGSVDIQVDSVYKFDEFEKAIDRLKSNRAQGKIVIEVSKD